MFQVASILAANDSDSGGRFLWIVIVLAIAAINAIVSAVKRRQEELHRDQVRAQIERGSQRQQQQQPRPVLQPAKQRVQPRHQTMTPMQAKRAVVRTVAQAKAAVREGPKTPIPAAVEARRSEPLARAAAPSIAARSQAPAVDARALSRWLTPATMRQQFILTEILQPPLALRA